MLTLNPLAAREEAAPPPPAGDGPQPPRVGRPPRKAPPLLTFEDLQKLLPRFFGRPIPIKTIRKWMDRAGLRKIKVNPQAPAGGGRVYFRRTEVEQWLRARAGDITLDA